MVLFDFEEWKSSFEKVNRITQKEMLQLTRNSNRKKTMLFLLAAILSMLFLSSPDRLIIRKECLKIYSQINQF